MSCPHCGFSEPMLDLDAAAVLIPVKVNTLRSYLARNKEAYPPHYRWEGKGTRKWRRRLLFASEIKRLRGYFVWSSYEEARGRSPHRK